MIRNPKTPWRTSKKLKGKQATKKRHLDEYFEMFGMFNSPCQICGGILERGEVDWAHKKHEGNGSVNTVKTNGLAAHGFRSGPANCHGWMDRKMSRMETAQNDTANLTNGEIIQWE